MYCRMIWVHQPQFLCEVAPPSLSFYSLCVHCTVKLAYTRLRGRGRVAPIHMTAQKVRYSIYYTPFIRCTLYTIQFLLPAEQALVTLITDTV
jgi:hypothetical protein